jgi:hypothetical protein
MAGSAKKFGGCSQGLAVKSMNGLSTTNSPNIWAHFYKDLLIYWLFKCQLI